MIIELHALPLAEIGLWSDLTQPLLWSGMLVYAAPLIFAALGGVVSERAGVVNIALEGMMLAGAFTSGVAADKFITVFHLPTGVALFGAVLAACAAGGALGWLLSAACVRFRANQAVVGMAINLIALGLTSYLFFTLYPSGPNYSLPGIPNWEIPGLGDITFLSLGQILFRQSPLLYLSVGAIGLMHIFLFHTKLGLRLRAVGESPVAASTAGIRVQRTRSLAVVASGALCGLGGAYLVMNGSPPLFTENITQGRGFIALAAVIVGRWTPLGATGACLLFGFGESLSVVLSGTTVGSFMISDYLLAMLPYILGVLVVGGLLGRSIPPASDGIPYDPDGAEAHG